MEGFGNKNLYHLWEGKYERTLNETVTAIRLILVRATFKQTLDTIATDYE